MPANTSEPKGLTNIKSALPKTNLGEGSPEQSKFFKFSFEPI
jgi:hypothetical protein